MKTLLIRKKQFTYFLLTIMLIGCKPTIALYDQYAYTQATSLKVDLQNLAMESDSISYNAAKPDIDKVNTELQKAYEYNKGRNLNSLSAKQYGILLSDNDFYKQFLNNWKASGKESEVFAQNVSEKIGQLMDQIIKLENGKNK
ncbi:MAG: hypothetical protein ABJA35_00845 [Parafilimonas sp.]